MNLMKVFSGSIERLLTFVNKERSQLETIISIGAVSPDTHHKLKQLGIQVHMF